MRHRKSGRKFGRSPSHRLAMLRNLVKSLFDHERIETTDTKAKELRRFAERLITMGKKGTVAARREVAKHINDKELITKLFGELTDRFKNRPGGYTRIMKLGQRQGDGAPMVLIELLGEDEEIQAPTEDEFFQEEASAE